MTQSMEIESILDRPIRPKPNGTHPLTSAVTRSLAIGTRQDVTRQGEVARTVHLLLNGYACRYRLLEDGRRQITTILVPGDICDLEALVRGRGHSSVATLSPCTLGEIPLEQLHDGEAARPELRRAIWRQILLDESIAREWLVVLGRRSARERIAHFLCECWERLRRIGLGTDSEVPFELTQADLADTLGLSVVHVNRTLQELRHGGWIRLKSRALCIVDHDALSEMAGFDPGYLRLS